MKNKGIFGAICAVDALILAGCIYLYVNQDRTAPVISFSNEKIVYTDGMDEEELLNGVSAYDEQDGDVSYSLLIEKVSNTADGQVVVTYAAKDASNNVAKNSRIIMTKGMEEETGDTPLPGPEMESESASETESETETETETQTDSSGEDDQEEEQEPVQEARQDIEQENGAGAIDNEEGQAEAVRENMAPVLTLSSSSISVSAGTATVDWNSCIQQLTDDNDSREQLFANLVMEGHVDLNTPGAYPVVLYTRDSAGAVSERRSVAVVVS